MENFYQILDHFVPFLKPNNYNLIIFFLLIIGGLTSISIVLWLIFRSIKIISKLFLNFFNILLNKQPSLIEYQDYIDKRQRFADHIESEIRRLNNLESWSHYRFTELEAEVETEGKYKKGSLFSYSGSGKQLASSLTEALKTSKARFILLEGAPGSGKSVAMRQVALTMARKAMHSNDPTTPLPIYVNLKGLNRQKWQTPYISTNSLNLMKLRQILDTRLDNTELKNLCYDLNIDYDKLSGDNKRDKARELISFCGRRDRLRDLIMICKSTRSDLVEDLESCEEFRTSKLPKIDKYLIRDFIWRSLNRANDRDILAFLEEEFDRGMRENTWVFLFDSFDEIPEVLSSTEADSIIQTYEDAIRDFLGGMNQCRGVVASRQYRGPKRLGWTKFRILPLNSNRQRELVQKSGLKRSLANEFVGRIHAARSSLRSVSRNPLFLNLLCEYMQSHEVFPKNTYMVYDEYIDVRLSRDAHRLMQRFALRPEDLRDAAEKLAFCMTADPKLGLSSTREELMASTKALQSSYLTVCESKGSNVS